MTLQHNNQALHDPIPIYYVNISYWIIRSFFQPAICIIMRCSTGHSLGRYNKSNNTFNIGYDLALHSAYYYTVRLGSIPDPVPENTQIALN